MLLMARCGDATPTNTAEVGAASIDPDIRSDAYDQMMNAWVGAPPNIIPICMVQLGIGVQPDVSNVYRGSGGGVGLRGVTVGQD
ncbi:hypothetical protein [Cumulibacter soli]|uniref:hypothetical protein n=1 Tax=Cumulibacter soli TaxID=2546344 RepID=UPI00106767C7|nr:hypothetical protein [Cumulibacter soli]